MADDFDYDTTQGFKRRSSELSEKKIEINQPTIEEQHTLSLSPNQPPISETVVSSAKEEREESEIAQLKKPKCYSSDDSEIRNQFDESEVFLNSITDDTTQVSKLNDFESNREIIRDAIKIEKEFDHSSWVVDGKLSVCEGLKGNGENRKCSLKIEVIDETALIETTSCKVGNGIGKEKGFAGFAKDSDGGVHKNVLKEKRARRRGKGAKKLAEVQNGCVKKGNEAKRGYSRQEMEALRYVNLEEQKEKWIQVYCGLDSIVAKEYDGLIDCNHQKHIRINFDPRKQYGKKEKTPSVLGEDCSQVMDNETENMNPLDPSCNVSVSVKDDCTVVEAECSEVDDSDDDYSSIQRPAFLVTGEPNFDSGPPLDGLEYLRRVRWEAAHIPKVKVAKLERSWLNKEQTVYMPKIPDIVKCPEHLLPQKQWEDTFIADFSELRRALSYLEGSSGKISSNLQFSSTVHQEEISNQLPESIIVEKFDNLTTDGVESYEALDYSIPEVSSDPQLVSIIDENKSSPSLENSDLKSFASSSSCDGPTLSAVLRMDSVARLSMLRKRIKLVENMSTLSRNDCAWLFALCAAIDTPLDADTCAALRCLLRKSASLRAEKSELDDEVVMLNILATITGKYFGQSEFEGSKFIE